MQKVYKKNKTQANPQLHATIDYIHTIRGVYYLWWDQTEPRKRLAWALQERCVVYKTKQLMPNCQEDSLSSSLKSLVSLILNGPDLKDQDSHETQPYLTAAPVSFSRNDVKTRHTLQWEPIYILTWIFIKSRNLLMNYIKWELAFHMTEFWILKIGLPPLSVNSLKRMAL